MEEQIICMISPTEIEKNSLLKCCEHALVKSMQHSAYAVQGNPLSDAFEDRKVQHQCYQLAESVL